MAYTAQQQEQMTAMQKSVVDMTIAWNNANLKASNSYRKWADCESARKSALTTILDGVPTQVGYIHPDASGSYTGYPPNTYMSIAADKACYIDTYNSLTKQKDEDQKAFETAGQNLDLAKNSLNSYIDQLSGNATAAVTTAAVTQAVANQTAEQFQENADANAKKRVNKILLWGGVSLAGIILIGLVIYLVNKDKTAETV